MIHGIIIITRKCYCYFLSLSYIVTLPFYLYLTLVWSKHATCYTQGNSFSQNDDITSRRLCWAFSIMWTSNLLYGISLFIIQNQTNPGIDLILKSPNKLGVSRALFTPLNYYPLNLSFLMQFKWTHTPPVIYMHLLSYIYALTITLVHDSPTGYALVIHNTPTNHAIVHHASPNCHLLVELLHT